MIKRIVKMSFKEDKIERFLQIFDASYLLIKAMKGCRYVELLQCPDTPHLMFTISIWDSEDDLNEYRTSELFQKTWSDTKILFSEKAQAWTIDSIKMTGEWM